MPRVPLSQLDDWGLVNEDQDLRGLRLQDDAGDVIGLITEMIVNTDAGYVDAVILDTGAEIPADEIEIGNDVVFLRPATTVTRTAVDTVVAPRMGPSVFNRAAAVQRPSPGVAQQVDEVKLDVVEEELDIGKREVEGGGVRVASRVDEVPVTEQVPLRQERLTVERRTVHRPATDAELAAFEEGTFEVRAYDEEAVVDKQAFVVEEIHIHKEVEGRTETIQETVRRMDVDVEEIPRQAPRTGD